MVKNIRMERPGTFYSEEYTNGTSRDVLQRRIYEWNFQGRFAVKNIQMERPGTFYGEEYTNGTSRDVLQ